MRSKRSDASKKIFTFCKDARFITSYERYKLLSLFLKWRSVEVTSFSNSIFFFVLMADFLRKNIVLREERQNQFLNPFI
jgi:hypothetical protein